ncbi:DUF1176 domain-containing protein [Xylophilus sp. GW821-FHT01B05]
MPAYREFRDWIVACDNLRRCEARLAPASGDEVELRLALARSAGPGGAVEIYLAGEKPLPAAAVRLDQRLLDSADQPAGAGSIWMADGEGGYRLIEDAAALRLARSLLLAQAFSVDTATTPQPQQLSLDGLAAAALFMDDVQGRVGNVSALVKPGRAPATQVPAEGVLPVLRAAPEPAPLADADKFVRTVRERQSALLAKRCDAPGAEPAIDEAQPLTADDALVLLQCWRGPYQSSALVLRVPRNAPERARPLLLPAVPGGLPGQPDDKDAGVLTEPVYDPATATLSSFAKGRGIGDCGVALGWVFDGKAFQAASRDEQRRCAGSPGDWPTLYRSQIQAAPAR